MSAYIITTSGKGFLLHGRYKTEDGAIRQLLKRIGRECFEIDLIGAEREPREVTEKWMTATCREVTVY